MAPQYPIIALLLAALFSGPTRAEEKVIRLGIIGLDTSHVTAFTDYLNDAKNETGCRVVAAFPGGSPDFQPSASRVTNFTELMKKKGVEIVPSIADLCKRVDGVLLESVDGRPHLEQVRPVIAAHKPVFIDKPLAANLRDAIEILRLAQEAGVPCWSSSDCRYSPDVLTARSGKIGKIVGCMAYGPAAHAAHHPDLYWYGVHTAETLFSVMGPGCVSVWRTENADADVVVGTWADGHTGIYRGWLQGSGNGGFVAFGEKDVYAGKWGEYDGLLTEIVKFFKTGKAPVPPEETIEIFAFMSAADESKAAGGTTVSLQSVVDEAKRPALAASIQRDRRLRVVVFGAHCDDPECGAGGLIGLLSKAGHEVHVAYLTTHRGTRTVNGEPEDTVRRRESTEACRILGAEAKFFPYPHEALYADTQTIHAVSDWLAEVKPDIVLTHWPLDTHPNHHVTSSLVWQAYEHRGQIWGQSATSQPAAGSLAQGDWNLYFYEVNTFTDPKDLETLAFSPTLYLDISSVRDTKKKALDCFKSQAQYNLWEVQDNMHRHRGAQCGVPFAEAYFLTEAKPGRPVLPVSFLSRRQ